MCNDSRVRRWTKDLNLAKDAAEDGCGGQSLDTGQFLAHGVVGKIEEVLVVARATGQHQVADGHGGGVVLHDGRRQHSRRQVLHLAGNERDDLTGGEVGVNVRPEVNLDDADAEHRA